LIGAAVVPTSIASAEVQLRIMQDFRSTVLTSAPSFALYIAEAIEKRGINPRTLSLKIGLFGAESWPEEVRKVLEEKLNIQAYEIFGVTELIEPGVAGECMAKNGLHVLKIISFLRLLILQRERFWRKVGKGNWS